MQHFIELRVWKQSHRLALAIYELTEAFPRKEIFGMVSQLRRAAASVPANLAEGSKRLHSNDYARFINISEGSLSELHYFLILGRDLGYASPQAVSRLTEEISQIERQLAALRSKVQSQGGRDRR